MTVPSPSVEQLTRALSAVGRLIAGIRDDQWSAPTPCAGWTVRDLMNHLVGVNLVFGALSRDQVPPRLGADYLGDDPAAAYRDTGAAVVAAFDEPGALKRIYQSQLGTASGAVRLHWRIADPRSGRFGPAQPVTADAPAIDRLVAFLGRPPAQLMNGSIRTQQLSRRSGSAHGWFRWPLGGPPGSWLDIRSVGTPLAGGEQLSWVPVSVARAA